MVSKSIGRKQFEPGSIASELLQESQPSCGGSYTFILHSVKAKEHNFPKIKYFVVINLYNVVEEFWIKCSLEPEILNFWDKCQHGFFSPLY